MKVYENRSSNVSVEHTVWLRIACEISCPRTIDNWCSLALDRSNVVIEWDSLFVFLTYTISRIPRVTYMSPDYSFEQWKCIVSFIDHYNHCCFEYLLVGQMLDYNKRIHSQCQSRHNSYLPFGTSVSLTIIEMKNNTIDIDHCLCNTVAWLTTTRTDHGNALMEGISKLAVIIRCATPATSLVASLVSDRIRPAYSSAN
jgi:hypothetical protein